MLLILVLTASTGTVAFASASSGAIISAKEFNALIAAPMLIAPPIEPKTSLNDVSANLAMTSLIPSILVVMPDISSGTLSLTCCIASATRINSPAINATVARPAIVPTGFKADNVPTTWTRPNIPPIPIAILATFDANEPILSVTLSLTCCIASAANISSPEIKATTASPAIAPIGFMVAS